MKLKNLILLLAIVLIFFCCAEKDETNDGIGNNDITLLTESQVSNFTYLLPVILSFSAQYNAGLSDAEKNSPDANKKFFKALKKSLKIQNSIKDYQFKSIDEMTTVYKNVVLEYTEIKRDLTNFTINIQTLRQQIDQSRQLNLSRLTNKDLSADDRKMIESSLRNDEARFSNILIVKKYESILDKVVQTYQ